MLIGQGQHSGQDKLCFLDPHCQFITGLPDKKRVCGVRGGVGAAAGSCPAHHEAPAASKACHSPGWSALAQGPLQG